MACDYESSVINNSKNKEREHNFTKSERCDRKSIGVSSLPRPITRGLLKPGTRDPGSAGTGHDEWFWRYRGH